MLAVQEKRLLHLNPRTSVNPDTVVADACNPGDPAAAWKVAIGGSPEGHGLSGNLMYIQWQTGDPTSNKGQVKDKYLKLTSDIHVYTVTYMCLHLQTCLCTIHTYIQRFVVVVF